MLRYSDIRAVILSTFIKDVTYLVEGGSKYNDILLQEEAVFYMWIHFKGLRSPYPLPRCWTGEEYNYRGRILVMLKYSK
jgi:hypothetical protein